MSGGAAKPELVLVTQFFRPETGAGARRVTALADALAAHFDVSVLTLEPGYPASVTFDRDAWQAADAAAPYPIARRAAFRPHDSSLARRALRELAMSRDLVAQLRGRGARLVVVSTPSMFLAPYAWWAARTSGAKFVWDLRDLTWRYARESAPTGGAARALVGALEGFMWGLLRRADLVVAATAGLADVVREHGVREARLRTVTNGVTRAMLARFGAAGAGASPRLRPCVGYVGLMGYNHGIGILLDVAHALQHVDFRLAGDGPERAAIEARIRDEGLLNVRLEGYVTDAAALEKLYRECDVLVNHTRGTPTLDRIVYPAKSFEYFATRRPVVYAGAGYAAELFTGHDLCAVVPPDDAAALARGIAGVLGDPATAAARAERARAFVEANACREDLMDALAAELAERFGGAR